MGLGYIMGGLVDAHPGSKRMVERPHLRQYHASKNRKGFKFKPAALEQRRDTQEGLWDGPQILTFVPQLLFKPT